MTEHPIGDSHADDHGPTPDFDRGYWEEHWQRAHDAPGTVAGHAAPNPQLLAEAGGLGPGTALDAGCGTGAESVWLASRGWRVTAVDISASALRRAAQRASDAGLADGIDWVEADLTHWAPGGDRFDLVCTCYAHPTTSQLEFLDGLAAWVAPGGTLVIVGHGPSNDHGHSHAGPAAHPPAAATFTSQDVVARLDPATWEIITAEHRTRTIEGDGRTGPLQDVVIRAVRRR